MQPDAVGSQCTDTDKSGNKVVEAPLNRFNATEPTKELPQDQNELIPQTITYPGFKICSNQNVQDKANVVVDEKAETVADKRFPPDSTRTDKNKNEGFKNGSRPDNKHIIIVLSLVGIGIAITFFILKRLIH